MRDFSFHLWQGGSYHKMVDIPSLEAPQPFKVWEHNQFFLHRMSAVFCPFTFKRYIHRRRNQWWENMFIFLLTHSLARLFCFASIFQCQTQAPIKGLWQYDWMLIFFLSAWLRQTFVICMSYIISFVFIPPKKDKRNFYFSFGFSHICVFAK